MSKIPDAQKVAQALKSTDKAIKASLRTLNQHAAQLMARGNYGGAEDLMAKGREIQSFRIEFDALRKRWGEVRGGAKKGPGNNSTTPLWAYYQPILQALVALGGEASRQEIEPQVEQLMKGSFQPGDIEPMARGRFKWQAMIRKAHHPLVKEGWLDARLGKTWRITTAGRQAAKAQLSTEGTKTRVIGQS